MGRIKPKAFKRAAESLLEQYPKEFTQDFMHNKKKVSEHALTNSRRVRNLIAGILTKKIKLKNKIPKQLKEEQTTKKTSEDEIDPTIDKLAQEE